MPLEPGARLGPYEVLAAAGDDLYKATDTQSNREVALQVLNGPIPEHFEQEAMAVAALNHPNIRALHDIGHQDGVDFLVLEPLEGETLAQRLENGPLSL